MNINLLPRENRETSKKVQSKVSPKSRSIYIGIFAIAAPLVFGISFLAGYLYHQFSVNEAYLKQLQMEINIYSTSYRKVQELETVLNKIKNKEALSRKVAADYIPPLQSLKILTGIKPESVWFEQIDFNGSDGAFILTGGAVNQNIMKKFTENIKQVDYIAGVQSKIFSAKYPVSGKSYLRFRINGVLAKFALNN